MGAKRTSQPPTPPAAHRDVAKSSLEFVRRSTGRYSGPVTLRHTPDPRARRWNVSTALRARDSRAATRSDLDLANYPTAVSPPAFA